MTLPNFLIIGAPKAGTSSLYSYLKQHPQIYMSPEKEPHFFGLENREIDFQGPGDLERYRNAVTQFEDYLKLFDGVTNEVAIGEASTSYLSNSQAPEKIKHYLPRVKLIAVLRNPVDAAYASFLHLLRDGDETITDFSLALQQEEARIKDNWEGIWHYRQRGLYYEQLKRYFELFDRKQLKIYLYEDFKNNSQFVLQDIFEFLNVESFVPNVSQKYNVSGMPKNQLLNRLISKPNILKSSFNILFPKSLRSSINTKVKNWNFNDFKKPPISPVIKENLTVGYREDILKLQDLIQQDLSSWLKT